MNVPLYEVEVATQYDSLFHSYRTNYKHAMKTCADLNAKKPNDIELLYWRLRLLHQNDRLADACDVLEAAAARKVIITDPFLLTGISAVYKQIVSDIRPGVPIRAPPPELQTLWDLAVQNNEKTNRALQTERELVHCGVVCEWWGMTVRGFFLLKKRVPRDNKHFYGHIAYNNLQVQKLKQDGDTLDEEKAKELAITERLGLLFVNSALTKTVAGQATPGRIVSARDFRMTIQTLKDYPDYALGVAAEISRPESPLYLFSSILNSNIEFLGDLLSIWSQNGRDQDIWSFCTEDSDGQRVIKPKLLSLYQHDFMLLDHLFQVANRIDDETVVSQFENLLSGLLAEEAPSREAHHLALRWYSRGGTATDKLFAVATDFWDLSFSQESCFSDLKQYFELFSEQRRVDFMSHITSTAPEPPGSDEDKKVVRTWMYQKVTILKFCYLHLALRSGWTGSGEEVAELESITVDAVKLVRFGNELKVRPPGAAIVLISSLLWRAHQIAAGPDGIESIDRKLIQTLSLTFYVNRTLDYSSEANVIATYLNMMAGLGGEAIRSYDRLAVRSLLTNSLSHILFTRFAVTHPFDSLVQVNYGGTGPLVPWDIREQLNNSITWEYGSRIHVESLLTHNPDQFQPDKVLELQQLRERLIFDTHFAIRTIEHRRLCRLRDWRQNSRFILNKLMTFIGNEAYTSDNRDASTLPNYELSSLPSFERSLQPRMVPGKNWIDKMLRIELISDMFWESKFFLPVQYYTYHLHKTSYWVRDARERPGMKPRLDQPADLWKSHMEGCTDVEQEIFEFWGLLEPFGVLTALPVDGKYPIKVKDLGPLLKRLQAVVDSEKKRYSNFSAPSPSLSAVLMGLPTQKNFVNRALYLLEFFQAVVKMSSAVSNAIKSNITPPHQLKAALPVQAFVALSASAIATAKTLQAYASDWRQSIRDGVRNLKEVEDETIFTDNGADEVGNELIGLITPVLVTRSVVQMTDEARNTLEGIMKIEVKR